jgi:hypothetical protein
MERVAENHPKAVVFYSTDQEYMSAWKEIAGCGDFESEPRNGFPLHWCRSNNMTFIISTGPTKPGISYAYYDRVGELMGQDKPGTA